MNPLIELDVQARNLADAKDFAGAVRLYKELLQRVPNWEHGRGCYDLAYTLEEAGEFREALEWYHRAIEQRPHDSYFWYGYASLAAEHGDPYEALKYLFLVLGPPFCGYPKKSVGTFLAVAGARAEMTQRELLSQVSKRTEDDDILGSVKASWPR